MIATVLIGALGYFVDIYDLLLFSIVRTASLRDLGVAPSESLTVGLSLLSWQMWGLLLGVGRKPDTLIGSVEQVSAKLGLVMLALGTTYLVHLLTLASMRSSARRLEPTPTAFSAR